MTELEKLEPLFKKYGVSRLSDFYDKIGSASSADALIEQFQATGQVDANTIQPPTADNGYSVFQQNNQITPPADPNFSTVFGDKDATALNQAFGGIGKNGNRYSGYVSPALSLASGLSSAYLGYQGLQETKKQNNRNYELAKEDARRGAVRYKNLVNEKKRATGLLLGNSNNAGATINAVNRTPYSTY